MLHLQELCYFSDGYLTSKRFIECEFVECNLSNVNVNQTSFLDCEFKNCKMLGIHFDDSNHLLFSASFENCQLDHSSFYTMKLKQIKFLSCSLEGVDFTDTELQEAVLTDCQMMDTKFERTNLEKADLRRSTGFSIDPDQNTLKKAKFSLSELEGLLVKYNIDIDRKS